MSDPIAAATVPSLPLESRDAAELPYAAFLRDYMRARRPVIVRGAVTDWPALRTWTPAWFKERFGDKRVQISYQDSMTFADFIDGVLASSHARPGPYMYRLFIHEHMPELLADLSPQNRYAFPRRFASPLMRTFWKRPDGYLKLLIGGIGGRFPVMHFDGEHAHATVTEIYGDKEMVMYAPADGAYLYPDPALPNKSRVVDPHVVDRERFPLQARATQYRGVIGPGDMVFIPCGWWHTARALTPSISVGMNILDESNWDGFVDDITEPIARPLRRSPVANRLYWKTLGPLLGALERVQTGFPALARALRLPARLAPDTSAVAPDPSTVRFPIRNRED